jgi:hypothetical protein
MFFSTVVSSMSVIGATMKKSMGLANKWTEAKSIYISLNDLSRETTIILAKNHLTPSDLDNIMHDIHNRLSLLEERSPLVDDGIDPSPDITMSPRPVFSQVVVVTPSV